jgi:hypothetical protein
MSTNIDDITMGDIPILLEMYKDLARDNEVLKEKVKGDKGTDLYY